MEISCIEYCVMYNGVQDLNLRYLNIEQQLQRIWVRHMDSTIPHTDIDYTYIHIAALHKSGGGGGPVLLQFTLQIMAVPT